MLDKIWWKIFEQTGDINAYLLYIDIKNLNGINSIDENSKKCVNVVNSN